MAAWVNQVRTQGYLFPSTEAAFSASVNYPCGDADNLKTQGFTLPCSSGTTCSDAEPCADTENETCSTFYWYQYGLGNGGNKKKCVRHSKCGSIYGSSGLFAAVTCNGENTSITEDNYSVSEFISNLYKTGTDSYEFPSPYNPMNGPALLQVAGPKGVWFKTDNDGWIVINNIDDGAECTATSDCGLTQCCGAYTNDSTVKTICNSEIATTWKDAGTFQCLVEDGTVCTSSSECAFGSCCGVAVNDGAFTTICNDSTATSWENDKKVAGTFECNKAKLLTVSAIAAVLFVSLQI